MDRIVGIDLGTTNSLVAWLDPATGRAEVLANSLGKRLTPSVVGVDRQGKIHVGETARNQLVAMPDRTVAEVKRLMGSGTAVRMAERSYSPQEISAFVLRALKADAEAHLGGPVDEAVVTVPAYFTDAQRQATKDAGELAGFRVERILNEPTAAALAFGLDRLDREEHVLVFDLGGGTLDVSVLEMFQGVLEVKASAGDNRLGGGDFDRAVAAWLCQEVERQHGVSVRADLQAMARLLAAAEQAKVALSAVEAVPILVPFLTHKGGEAVSLEVELTRARLEELIGPLVRSALAPVERALADSRLERSQLTEVVLVGGSSRVPLVQRVVAEFLGRAPRHGVNPDEAIALGAAVQAGIKAGTVPLDRGIMITDVCPFTLGVEVHEGSGPEHRDGLFSPILRRNVTVPASRTEIYSTTSDGQRAVEIRVFQGESRLVRENVLLDRYLVEGVPPAPGGVEKVAVTFSYDLNGILHVNTRILSTGREAKLTVDRSRQRLAPADRLSARARMDAEWRGAVPPPAPAAATAPDPLRSLVRAAAMAAPPGDREQLAFLAGELEQALDRADGAASARIERELSEVLARSSPARA